jgi:hypothetical protein
VLTARIINLPPHMRDHQDYMLLLGMYSTKHAKSLGGTCRMLCGIHQTTGKTFNEPSLRADLLQLQKGIGPFLIPDDENGGTVPIMLEAHFLGFCADQLGAHGLGPWPESFKARHSCSDCWWHARCFCAHLPADSPELTDRKSEHCQGCRGKMELRTQQGFKADIARLRCAQFKSKKARDAAFRDAGINKLHCALQYIPGAVLTTDARLDTMHLWWCGLSKYESAFLLGDLIPECFSWDDLNDARSKLLLPKGHKIPELRDPCADGSKAKCSASMRLKAGEMMHFVLHRCGHAARCNTSATMHVTPM